MESNLSRTNGPLLVDLVCAAKLLSLSQKTVWTYAKAGRIPSIKCGTRRLFPVAALERWIETQLESQSAVLA